MSEPDISNLDTALFTYEQAKQMLLEAGELVVPGQTSKSVPFGIGGLIIGAGLGAAGAYFITRKRLEEKFRSEAAEEVERMRVHYVDKARALENTVAKPALDTVVQEKIVRDEGYSSSSPVGIRPPESVVEAAEQAASDAALQPGSTKPKPPVPVDEPIERNVFRERQQAEEAARAAMAENEWDPVAERAKRSPLKPYVIHRDEVDESRQGGYDEVTFTYYEADDVICNERDEPVANPERDLLVGEHNLLRFGHGSDDPNIVYIRHDPQELIIELVKSPNSFAEEVHGFKHSDETYRRMRKSRERPPFRDE